MNKITHIAGWTTLASSIAIVQFGMVGGHTAQNDPTDLVGPDDRTGPTDLPGAILNTDFLDDGTPSQAKVDLGKMLFFDKVLSGNKNISCATCHHPQFASSDGLALGFGEGPNGLGPDRAPGQSVAEAVHERVPRNSPALFNLGAREYTKMFHDGRVELDTEGFYESGFISPAKWKLPTGLDSVLAAQAMFPVTSPTEMAGQQGENDIANARALNNAAGHNGIWELLARRLQAIPEYVQLFQAAYPIVEEPDDITFVMAANAIAAFETVAFRADDSSFDQYLRGDASLTSEQSRGMDLFYGEASCVSCHAGKFQTDHDFHAIAMPQIGPGKSDGWNADYWRTTGIKAFPEDFGRGRVTVREEDNYKFRTPSLRNVAQTGPWGHAGAYTSLEDVVLHHLDPVAMLDQYTAADVELSPFDGALELTAEGSRLRQSWLSDNRFQGYVKRDTWVQSNDKLREQIAAANELAPIELTATEIRDLLAFLESLSDTNSLNLDRIIPERVPSGLPVNDEIQR